MTTPNTGSSLPSITDLLADASDKFNGRTIARTADDSARLVAQTPANTVAPVARTAAGLVNTRPMPEDKPVPADFERARRDGSRGFSHEGAERAARDAAAAAAVGIALAPPVYALGSLLCSDGVSRAAELRRDFEALPEALSAMSGLRAEVAAERRADITMRVSEIRMNARGAIVHPALAGAPGGVVLTANGGAVRIERDALAKLSRTLRDDCDVEGDLGIVALASKPRLTATAAKVWNDAAVALGEDEATRKADDKGKLPEFDTVTLRTRMARRPDDSGRDFRQVFAVVSEKYGQCDTDKIADAVARMRDASKLRASVHYDRSGVAIDLLTHTKVRPGEQVAGEVFRAGIRITSDDTGGGSIKVRAIVERNLCLNVIIVDVGEGAQQNIRHLGDPAKVAAKLDSALAAANRAIAHFIRQWDEAAIADVAAEIKPQHRDDAVTLTDLLDEYNAAQQRDALACDILEGTYRGLLAELGLVPSRQIEDNVSRLLAAHWDPRNESGARRPDMVTRGAVANGLTLWAQDLDPVSADKVERFAGQIVSGDLDLTYSPKPKAAAA